MKTNLYIDALRYDGGVIRFIDYLDKNNIAYELRSKKPSARIIIKTPYGNLNVYDRRKSRKVRMDIPWRHPLSSEYEKYNGYLFNETNKNYKTQNYISVFFDEKDFADLILFIRNNMD